MDAGGSEERSEMRPNASRSTRAWPRVSVFGSVWLAGGPNLPVSVVWARCCGRSLAQYLWHLFNLLLHTVQHFMSAHLLFLRRPYPQRIVIESPLQTLITMQRHPWPSNGLISRSSLAGSGKIFTSTRSLDVPFSLEECPASGTMCSVSSGQTFFNA